MDSLQEIFSRIRAELSGQAHYSIFKKDRCEQCGFIAEHPCQLDVDHIDGNHFNDDESNYRTLCANCHRLKTWASTPAPGTLGAPQSTMLALPYGSTQEADSCEHEHQSYVDEHPTIAMPMDVPHPPTIGKFLDV